MKSDASLHTVVRIGAEANIWKECSSCVHALMTGGRSKYVCLYGAQDRILMRRFQLSHNQSLDGVLDQLNSKNVTDAGPVQLLDDDDDSADELQLLGPAGCYLPI